MKKTLLSISSIVLFSFQSMAGDPPVSVSVGDSVKIVIGDTIRIENSGAKNNKVEIAVKEIVKILEGDNTVIISDKDKSKVIVLDGDKESKGVEVIPAPQASKTVVIDKDGVKVKSGTTTSSKRDLITTDYLMLDLGVNALHDKTNYNTSAAASFLQVPEANRNANLFNLKPVASLNVNLWPIIVNLNAVSTRNQRVILSSGLGIQWYNFKFNTPVSFDGSSTNPHIYLEPTAHFTKNKLGITYGSIPLLLTLQSRISSKRWLTYGVGVIGGYRLTSWTKQKSSEYGKVKNKYDYNMNPFQLSATAEIGIKGILRLYGTYQITNMWKDNTLEMHPFAIGIRFFGI